MYRWRRGIRAVREAHVDGWLATDGQSRGVLARDAHRVAAGDLGMAANETMVLAGVCVRAMWVVPDQVERGAGR